MDSVKTVKMKIDFCDLKRGYRVYRDEIGAAVDRVLVSGNYILGEETASFEREFADYCGSSYGIGVGSGTEALHIALLAAGIGHGSEVITAANAGVPTVTAIMLAGARPVFADIDEKSYTIDVEKIEKKKKIPLRLSCHSGKSFRNLQKQIT